MRQGELLQIYSMLCIGSCMVAHDMAQLLMDIWQDHWFTEWQDPRLPVNHSFKTEMLTGYEQGAAFDARR